MLSSNLKIYQDTEATLSVIEGMGKAYSNVKKVLNRTLILTLVPLVVVFVRIILYFMKNKIKKSTNRLRITTRNYHKYMEAYVILNKKKKEISELTDRDVSSFPWFLRGVVKDINEISRIASVYHDELEKALGDPNSKKGEYFEYIPPKELWSRRAKAYSYKL